MPLSNCFNFITLPNDNIFLMILWLAVLPHSLVPTECDVSSYTDSTEHWRQTHDVLTFPLHWLSQLALSAKNLHWHTLIYWISKRAFAAKLIPVCRSLTYRTQIMLPYVLTMTSSVYIDQCEVTTEWKCHQDSVTGMCNRVTSVSAVSLVCLTLDICVSGSVTSVSTVPPVFLVVSLVFGRVTTMWCRASVLINYHSRP